MLLKFRCVFLLAPLLLAMGLLSVADSVVRGRISDEVMEKEKDLFATGFLTFDVI